MSGIIARSSRRLATQFSRSLATMSFSSQRPGEPTPPISDAHRGPTGVLEVSEPAQGRLLRRALLTQALPRSLAGRGRCQQSLGRCRAQ